jgi:hypothetical protein
LPPLWQTVKTVSVNTTFGSIPTGTDGDPLTVTNAQRLSTGCMVSVVNGTHLSVMATPPWTKMAPLFQPTFGGIAAPRSIGRAGSPTRRLVGYGLPPDHSLVLLGLLK